jgi:choline dehydrogenase-like flavoprotein
MLLDARSVPTGTLVEAELCIVGAGAAGITLAREFANTGFRVVLMESGSTDFDADTQALYAGSDIGRPYQDLTACRLRFFGGTTNHWGGWCLPLEPVDMVRREGIPHTGWPFERAQLDPWYQRAQPVCQIGPFEYTPARWGIDSAKTPDPFRGPHFVTKILQESPPTRFGSVYRSELEQAPRVAVYMNANGLRFTTDEAGREVQELEVGTLSGNRFRVRAKIYVLAAGGIENARLLLLSGRPEGSGLGNKHDLVGRFFMVHLNYTVGEVALTDPYADFDFCTGRDGANYGGFGRPQRFVSFVGLSQETMIARSLPGISFGWFYKFGPVAGTLNALKRLLGGKDQGSDRWADFRSVIRDIDGLADYAARKALFHEGAPVEALDLYCWSEQLPNPDSRIRLGTETDALGLRKVAVDWHLTADDKHSALTTLRLFGTELGRVGFGRLRLGMDDSDDTWPGDMFGDAHHMGTTRMHRDPAQGVVDENCRLHDVANLYVAGSSVFPTSGAANPTLTIVALALRLADHIKEKLA